MRGPVILLVGLALAGCAGQVLPKAAGDSPPRQAAVTRPIPAHPAGAADPGATSAVQAGLLPGPALATLPLGQRPATGALAGFRASCAALLRRTDQSGLTRNADWRPACDAARDVGEAQAARFFGDWFEAVQVGDGRATATGYYEPEIAGARERRDGYPVPIYARPDDLIEVDLGLFSDGLKGKRIRGKVQGRAFVPYDDRAQIDAQGLAGRARIIAWAADPVELFFLQIQGSGRLRLPDGAVMRIGYDNQNGRDYTGIGQLLLQRGLIPPGQASMQGIMAWLRANPDQGRAIMEENRSFVFFREIGDAPLGALGLQVMAQVSAAVDPRFIPLGAPVLLSMDRAEASGLWIAQDTGGAIKGANRVDTFWGAGEQARTIAGGMKARGTAWVLLPRGTYQRLVAEGRIGGAVAPVPDPLDPAAAALWGRVVATVAPLPGRRRAAIVAGPPQRAPRATRVSVPIAPAGPARRAGGTLDGGWDRRLARGGVTPDRSIDLHGETLDRAYALIDAGLAQAIGDGARVLLLVTGKVRPDARGGRGAIRALVPDWLAHSRHAAAIAAVRPAHPRHGGAGALYVILRRG